MLQSNTQTLQISKFNTEALFETLEIQNLDPERKIKKEKQNKMIIEKLLNVAEILYSGQ